MEEAQLGDRVARTLRRRVRANRRRRRLRGAGLRSRPSRTPYKRRRRRYRNRLRPGTGPVPLQSNRNRRRLAAEPGLLHPVTVADRAARPARASSRTRGSRFPAAAAEPPGPGLGRARDPLAHEVRFLGSLLGQVIAEQAGPELFATVERIRRRTIALRRGDPEVVLEPDIERERLGAEIGSLDVEHAAAVARAFTLYFQLVNLAEERQRIRMLRTRARRAKGRPIDESLGEAVERLAAVTDRAGLEARLRTVEVHPVLTAHPTEARRRTLLVALRRIRRLLDALDDSLTTPDEDADLRRRLREEITLLWHTGDLRAVLPTPLDEVRSALAIFDETLFTVVPRYVRALDRALDSVAARGGRADDDAPPALAVDAGRTGTRPVAAPSLLRFGSWIGSDRDGHPGVTAEITLHAARLQADHLLRGYEAVAARLMQTVAARVAARAGRPGTRPRPRARRGRAARDDAPASAPVSRGALPAAAGRDRGAHPADTRGDDRRAGRAFGRLRGRGGARRGAGLAPARAGRGRARPGGLGRGRGAALAAGDVRVPPRLARGPPARRGASGGAGGPADGRRTRRRGRGRGHGRRAAGDVPGDRAAPGEVRRRGVPAVRDLVHDQPRRRRGGAGARAPGRGARAVRPAGRRPHRPAAGPARPRRRPAARERRRPVAARPSSSTACSPTRPTVPTSAIGATPRR